MLIKRILLSFVLFGGLFLSYFFLAPRIYKSNAIVSPVLKLANPVEQIKLTPTPTPYMVDQKTNLYQESQSLTPESFDSDFDNLNQKISQF